MVTSDLLKLLAQQEKDEKKQKDICNDFHAATSFKEWKKGKSTEESLHCMWYILKQLSRDSQILSRHEAEMDNELTEIKDDFNLDIEGIWSYALKEKIIIAREAAMTARALHTSDLMATKTITDVKENLDPMAMKTMNVKENLDPNHDSVSVAFAKLSDMHHLWRITKEMDELEVPRKSEIKSAMEIEREKLIDAESMDEDDTM
jgi:hypothetical protein